MLHATPKKIPAPLMLAPLLALLLQACVAAPATAPPEPVVDTVALEQELPEQGGDLPELELHLPPPGKCDCKVAPTADYTFFEKGYRALLDGEYEDAMQHFQRYQRLENSPRADLEAGIAIDYIRMLPRSSFYDPKAARESFKELRERNAKELGVHDYTRLMRQALLNLLELQDKISKLRADNAVLTEDLQKREEALKRLRDLTLNQNQKGASP
jgi:TolA-binding protein